MIGSANNCLQASVIYKSGLIDGCGRTTICALIWHRWHDANALDYQLAFDVKEFFRLSKVQATQIYDEVLSSVKEWQTISQMLGISRAEQAIKAQAFNV